MRCLMNTGRTIPQGSCVEHKYHPGYQREVSGCRIHPVDMMELGIEEGDHVRLTTGVGSVVMHAIPDERLTRGEIYVAYGPYANHIIGETTTSTGMPDLKSTQVEMEPTDDPILSVRDLMKELGGCAYEGE
ncbi:MAG: molybdopterin dinucleotide binding domain-containing protein [Methanomicrobiales archaeon]